MPQQHLFMSLRRAIIALSIPLACLTLSHAQENTSKESNPDTIPIDEVIISAARIPVTYRLNTTAASIVTPSILEGMAKTIAADEALRLVPGVRVENQAGGSRLHMSVRGQGILSERGLRGIKVLIDGIPVNDPSGFAPDLYDVDWETVDRIEVLRGPATSIYGGGGSAGVLNIITRDGGTAPFNGTVYSGTGSYGFFKGFGQIGGTAGNINYRVSYSHIVGDAYRDHAAYWADNLSEKLIWTPSGKLRITQVLIVTTFFNQNAEGLSLEQVAENPRQANPDANPFNEYQKTNRITQGVISQYTINQYADIQAYGFIRSWRYKETSNKAAQYRDFVTPGFGAQLDLHFGAQRIRNHLSIGTDAQWQTISEYKLKSLSNPLRKESTDEANLEDTLLLANQLINQQSTGVYVFDKLEISGKLNLTAGFRYDNISNALNDKLNTGNNLSGEKNFNKVTGRIGVAYSLNSFISCYANWAQGFMPPATEELASNPLSFGGFNENLEPATSVSKEIGIRGFAGNRFRIDVNGFYMTTEKDFFRFKLYPARGNQEVFYGNTGSTERYGIESYASYSPVDKIILQGSYTYSHFRYTSPDSLKGFSLPNSPEHQVYLDISYRLVKNLSIGASYEMQTKWFIYTDAIHHDVFQDGFNLLHARISYIPAWLGLSWEFGAFVRNLTNEHYIAFTEPDPDGNCYQPAPGREFFINLRVRF